MSAASTHVDTGGHAGPQPTHAEQLSTQRVLQAALQVVDAEGLDALTMRRLGRALGRQAMSLYRYTGNRPALLDGITELVLHELVIPVDDGRHNWQGQLRQTAHNYRQVALNHPHVVPLLVTRALRTYRIYFSYLQGHILTELQEPNETDRLQRGLQRLPLKEFPVLRSLAGDLDRYNGAAELDQAMDVFL